MGRHDGAFVVPVRIVDDMLEQESVELRLGQRVRALLLDRVLRRHDHEAVLQRVVHAVDSSRRAPAWPAAGRPWVFGGVRLTSSAKSTWVKTGPLVSTNRESVKLKMLVPMTSPGHQVWRELDSTEVEIEGRGEAARDHRLGRAGHALRSST